MRTDPGGPRGARRFLEARLLTLLILGVSLFFVAESLTLRGDSGKYPLVVGVLTAVLAALDLVRPPPAERVAAADPAPRSRKLLLAAWFGLAFGLFYALGVIAAIAVAGAAYFVLFTPARPLVALLAGLAHAAAFWVAFDVLAGFRLYAGVF